MFNSETQTGIQKIKDLKTSSTTVPHMLQAAIYKYTTESMQLPENCFFKQLILQQLPVYFPYFSTTSFKNRTLQIQHWQFNYPTF